ncbi:MAG TPA: hypothetical protein VFA26_17015, partial [Gemmataceae bacterium]|nr:hypothetical protein [Gemmataceae bacterium]
IVLTDADVRNEVNRDLLNRDPLDGNEKKDAEKFGKYLGTQAGKVTVKDMYNALRNEYRVALAQAALTGAVPGVRGYRRLDTDTNQVPAVVTPADFWNYYKDNRTTLKVDLLPVPVSGFLDQAPTPGKENEKELQTLYRRYKGSEPLPDSETPGFKVPRRVRIAWVGGTRDAALYRKEAAEILRVSDALSRLGAGANGLASGGGPANWAVRLALPAAGDLRTSAEYATYLTRQPSWLEAPQALLQQHRLHDTSACAPAAVAAAVGQLLGAAATGGPAAAVPVSAEGSALNVETRERVRILGTSMMACASPSPLTALALTAPVVPRPLPLSAVRGQLDEQAVNALAAEFLVNNADKLRKDLEAAGRKPDQLLKVAREKAPAYGLSVHVMGEESDPYHLADAPALREFRSWYRQRPPVDDPRGNRFAALFLQKDGVGVVQSFPPQQRLEQVQKLMQDPNLKFLLAQLMPLPDYVAMWWKVEDKEAYVPSFEEARPKVVEAWRAQKARELAQAEADKLAAAARKAGIDADKFLRDEAARHPAWGDVRELDNVARLVTPRKALIGPTEYFPYQPDPSLKLRPDFVDDLMRHLKEKGDTTVVANGPKDVFYVVLLRDRAEPSEKQFYTAYSETPLRDTLWVRFERRQRERYRQQAVEQLRREASPDGVENGKWKLPPELRKDAEGGGRWDGE